LDVKYEVEWSVCKVFVKPFFLTNVQVYVLWLHLIFVSIIPFSILLLLNCIIHRKLWEVTIVHVEMVHSQSNFFFLRGLSQCVGPAIKV
jgi:hypothetical protein